MILYQKILKKIFPLFTVICVIPATVSAEELLPLEQAIGIALKNNNGYKISMEKVRESKLKVRETWGGLWPQLSSDASYTRMWAEEGMSANIEGQYNIKFVNGQFSVNPGAFYHTLQSSYSGNVAAENEVRTARADVVIRTIQLYYQTLLASKAIELREDSIKALDENLRIVTAGYERGTFSRLDFLRAKVALSNEKTKLINSKNDLLTIKAVLNIHLGREINETLMPDKKALDVNIDSLLYREQSEEKEREFLNRMIADALQNRPELLQIKLGRESLRHAENALDSVYLWPSFFVSGSYGTSKSQVKESDSSDSSNFSNSSNSKIDPQTAFVIEKFEEFSKKMTPGGWNDSWSITFGATYRWGSIAPFDSTHAKASQMESKTKQADLQLQDFIRQIKLDVQQKYLKLKSASNSIYSQQGNVETAEETMRVATLQFRNGIIDNSKLLEANVGLTTARTLFIEALHNYQVARAELNRAIGRDYFEIK